MQNTFEQRLSTAVRAGWWTLLIALGVVLLQWFGTAVFFDRHPDWFLRMWGPDMTWASIETTVLQFLLLFRIFVGAFLVILIWATLWSRSLRKRASVSRTADLAPSATPAPLH
jgi:hypothetical protein